VTITVTIMPTALIPAIYGDAMWCAGRCFRGGITTLDLIDAEQTEIEQLSALNDEVALIDGGPLGRPVTFRRATDTVVEVVATDTGAVLRTLGVPSSWGLPAVGQTADPSTRTTIGQASYRALLADRRLLVEVLP
jgi:hypothetical protein